MPEEELMKKRRKEGWMDAHKWKQNKTGRDKSTVIIKSKV
jgi:hypothetical protein